MDPHLQGAWSDAFDERERMQSGQRGRGRVHQHAQRLHGLVPGQADQDGVRHEYHGPSTRARSCGIIGGGGINDESNKTAPAPSRNANLTKYTGSSCTTTKARTADGSTPPTRSIRLNAPASKRQDRVRRSGTPSRRGHGGGSVHDGPDAVLLQFFLSNFCTVFPRHGLPVSSRNCTV